MIHMGRIRWVLKLLSMHYSDLRNIILVAPPPSPPPNHLHACSDPSAGSHTGPCLNRACHQSFGILLRITFLPLPEDISNTPTEICTKMLMHQQPLTTALLSTSITTTTKPLWSRPPLFLRGHLVNTGKRNIWKVACKILIHWNILRMTWCGGSAW